VEIEYMIWSADF